LPAVNCQRHKRRLVVEHDLPHQLVGVLARAQQPAAET
jgi:hypothetical protein